MKKKIIVIFVLIVIHIILGATFYHKTKQIDKFMIILFFILLFLEAYLIIYIILEFKKRNYKFNKRM